MRWARGVGVFLILLIVSCSSSRKEAEQRISEDSLQGHEWTELPGRPSEDQLRCAAKKTDFWAVSMNGGVSVEPHAAAVVSDPLPFDLSPASGQVGKRHVLALSDGWLVGFDAGEWGGGLWWFGRDGHQSLRLRPPAPRKTEEGAEAPENVQGFVTVGGDILVFMGLDHLLSRSGRVFRVTGEPGEWRLADVATLDASAAAWFVEGDEVLVVTAGGLWKISPDRGPALIHPVDLESLAPTSIVRNAAQNLVIGLRHYVLMLHPGKNAWSETWFAPSGCVKFRMEADCKCSQR